MMELLTSASQFIFLILLAALISSFLLIGFYSLRYFFWQKLVGNLRNRFEYELKNYLFSESPSRRFPGLSKRIEVLLISQLEQTGFSGSAYSRLSEIWHSLGLGETNLRRLSSRRERERAGSALTLSLFRYEKAKRPIRNLLQDPSEKVRWAAGIALLGLKDEQSLQYILESVRGSSLFSLIQLQPDLYELGREGVFSLEEALQHPEADVRILTLGIVARLKQEIFLRFLGRLLEDRVLDVRMKALSALAEIGKGSSSGSGKLPQELEEILSSRLGQASWEEIARILQVVGAWKLKKFISDVETQVTHLHPWVRYRALETLLQLGEEGRRRALVILEDHRHIVFPIFEDLDVRP